MGRRKTSLSFEKVRVITQFQKCIRKILISLLGFFPLHGLLEELKSGLREDLPD